MRLWVKLTFLSDMCVRLIFGQMDPLAVISCGQVYSYFSQVDQWSDISPLDKALGQVDIFVRYLGQADLWSMDPPGETSCGQVHYICSQVDL